MANQHTKNPQDTLVRFEAKVERIPFSGCWLWIGAINVLSGYGEFFAFGKVNRAHRFAYQQLIGPVPDGLELDHLCRVRSCVNPNHLEPVTRLENMFRSPFFYKESCKKGHSFKPENTFIRVNGVRSCLECMKIWKRESTARVKLGLQRVAIDPNLTGEDGPAHNEKRQGSTTLDGGRNAPIEGV